MKQKILLLFAALLLINFSYGLEYKYSFNSLTQPQIYLSDIPIHFNDVSFSCSSSGHLIGEQQVRCAPQGTLQLDCSCISVYSAANELAGQCKQENCKTIINNANEPSCWHSALSIGKDKTSMLYGERTKINNYLQAEFTANSCIGRNDDNDYGVNLKLYFDLSDSLKLSIIISSLSVQNANAEICYENSMADNLQGYIYVQEKTNIFLPASVTQDIPVTFNLGSDCIRYETASVLGSKTIYATPYLELRDSANTLMLIPALTSKTTFKAEQDLSKAHTELYFDEGFKSTWLYGIWLWFKGAI